MGKYQAVIHNRRHERGRAAWKEPLVRVLRLEKKKKGGELWSPLEFIIKAKLLLFTPQSLCNVGAKLCLFSITAAERKNVDRTLGLSWVAGCSVSNVTTAVLFI